MALRKLPVQHVSITPDASDGALARDAVRVPARRDVRTSPRSYVATGRWPDAVLERFVPAQFAQVFVRNLLDVADGLSVREIGRRADLSHRTVQLLLSGESWPDMVSVAKLEAAFHSLLWPRDAERLTWIDPSDDPHTAEERALAELERAGDSLDRAWATFRSKYPDSSPVAQPDIK